jgi:hypothetical protein
MSHELGPLPKGDRQDTLQQLSIRALRNLLPEDQFLFRDERVDDKGVDGALEVKVEGDFTNCRAQVQLKSTDADPGKKGDFNEDGSYSQSIDTSNLNYLLNGPSPLYVIWFSKLNELRFAWAHDEWQKLDANNPDWKKQGSFTIRFSRVFTPAELPDLRNRILDESQLHRRIHESLARSAPAEDIVVSINAKTLASTDPKELYERLSKSGMTIVSSGYGKQVLEWYSLLNPEKAKEPRLRLVAAFAASSIGRYHEAKGYLAAAVLEQDKLSQDDSQFLEYLSSATDYHTGRIDRAAYLQMEADWAGRLTGTMAAEHRLEVLRHQRLAEREAEHRAKLLSEMQALAADIEAAPAVHSAQKIQARLILLAAEGDDLNTQFLEDRARVAMRENMGFSAAAMAADAANAIAHRWAEWEKRASTLRDQAIDLGHPLLIADSMTARLRLYVSFFLRHRMNALTQGIDEEVPKALVNELEEDAAQAMEVCRLAGSLSGELEVKMLLADLNSVCGDDEAAKGLATSVLPVARAMNYDRLASRAAEHLDGQTVLHQFLAQLQRQPTNDEMALSQTDDDIRAMARMALESLGIPVDRLPLVEKDCFAGRVIARERRAWCRHIQLHQNLAHSQIPETAYDVDPERICVCTKLGHQSNIPHADYDAVIVAFKRNYCDGCTYREPSNPSA